MGFSRQLTAAEIFEQAQRFSSELRRPGTSVPVSSEPQVLQSAESGLDTEDGEVEGEELVREETSSTTQSEPSRLSNVVFMGMGEPLANYDNVIAAVRRINTELGIGARHITISTVGIAPRIRKLADEGVQVGLAISLHQASDKRRSALMPVNKRYPIPDLLDACRYYIRKTNRRISFEWALIRGETDTAADAHTLGKLLKGMLCHVNVIPLNPTEGYGGQPTKREGVQIFIDILATYGVTCTARVRRGIDIDAGCGQLKAELLKAARLRRPGPGPGLGLAVPGDCGDVEEASFLTKSGRIQID
jgi:23S rRNA (adenine2503-C2)-methyltransferase